MSEKKWRVLIVEDDTDVSEVLQVILQLKYGCEVTVVKDGAAAIECARGEQPDLILMDLVLPVMNGFEATRHLTADATTTHIPVVAISDHSWEETVYDQAIQAGCRACINKADLFGDLHRTIHRIMHDYVTGAS